jgi:hypothetical protein
MIFISSVDDLSVSAWKAGCGGEKAVAEEVNTDYS